MKASERLAARCKRSCSSLLGTACLPSEGSRLDGQPRARWLGKLPYHPSRPGANHFQPWVCPRRSTPRRGSALADRDFAARPKSPILGRRFAAFRCLRCGRVSVERLQTVDGCVSAWPDNPQKWPSIDARPADARAHHRRKPHAASTRHPGLKPANPLENPVRISAGPRRFTCRLP
jgi:hypothetical protein